MSRPTEKRRHSVTMAGAHEKRPTLHRRLIDPITYDHTNGEEVKTLRYPNHKINPHPITKGPLDIYTLLSTLLSNPYWTIFTLKPWSVVIDEWNNVRYFYKYNHKVKLVRKEGVMYLLLGEVLFVGN